MLEKAAAADFAVEATGKAVTGFCDFADSGRGVAFVSWMANFDREIDTFTGCDYKTAQGAAGIDKWGRVSFHYYKTVEQAIARYDDSGHSCCVFVRDGDYWDPEPIRAYSFFMSNGEGAIRKEARRRKLFRQK